MTVPLILRFGNPRGAPPFLRLPGRWSEKCAHSEVRMELNQDFYDLLQYLNAEQVEYLIVGGYAVMYYSEPRYTKDLDIWINPHAENALAVWRALAAFGAPMDGVTLDDFIDKEMIYQIGIAPNRIDIIMDVLGVDFTAAWQRRKAARYGDTPMNIIGKEDLIQSKLAAGRDQDLLDAKKLQEKRNMDL